MADEDAGTGGAGDRTFTQAEVDELVKGLKTNQQEAIKEAKKAKEALKGYDGVDPEEFKRLKKAAEEAEEKRAKGEGDWKALEDQLKQRHAQEMEKATAESKRLRSSLESHLIDAEAVRALAEHSDSPSLLLPHVRGRMKVIEQDGEFFARVVDEKGNVRIGNAQGAPMSLSELIEEMKQDKTYAPAFRGTGSSGGGASKSAAGSGGAKVLTVGGSSVLGKDFALNAEKIAKGEMEVRRQ